MKKTRPVKPRKVWDSLARLEELKSQEARCLLNGQEARIRDLEARGRRLKESVDQTDPGLPTSARNLEEEVRRSEMRLQEYESVQARLRAVRDMAANLEERAASHAAQALMFKKLRER